MGHLGPLLGTFGALLGPLGCCWPPQGVLRAPLGGLWGSKGASWSSFDPSGRSLGLFWTSSWAVFGHFGALGGSLGSNLGYFASFSMPFVNVFTIFDTFCDRFRYMLFSFSIHFGDRLSFLFLIIWVAICIRCTVFDAFRVLVFDCSTIFN